MTRREPEPGLAIAANRHDPATRERAVPIEPSVVIARGVVAFDERGQAMGALVHDMRAKADTVPPQEGRRAPLHVRHLRLAFPSSRRQSVLLLGAATFFLASAGLLAWVLHSLDAETPGLAAASAVAMVKVKPDAPSRQGSSEAVGTPAPSSAPAKRRTPVKPRHDIIRKAPF